MKCHLSAIFTQILYLMDPILNWGAFRKRCVSQDVFPRPGIETIREGIPIKPDPSASNPSNPA